MLRVLDIFSGIGAFSLGLERTGGFRTVAFCEIEAFPRRVLAKHWPKVPCYDDVRSLTAARLASDGISADVICGGFPCQDISVAGRGAGISGERSGLWSEFARLIGEVRPQYAIIENVAALVGRGLIAVLGELAALGYDAEWRTISAANVGAPHLRERVWIVAYPSRQGRWEIDGRPHGDEGAHGPEYLHIAGGDGPEWDVGHPNGAGRQGQSVEHGRERHARPEAEWAGSALADADSGRRREQGDVAEAACAASAGQSGNGCAPATYTDEIGCAGRTTIARGWQDERRPWRSAERPSEAVALSSRPRLAIGQGTLREWAHAATTGTGWWATEPGLGRTTNGTTQGLDENRIDATQIREEDARGQILRAMRVDTRAQGLSERTGGEQYIPSPEVLRSDVHGWSDDKGDSDARHIPLASTPDEGEVLRGVRNCPAVAGASCRSESGEQQSGECANAVQDVSRLLALGGKADGQTGSGTYAGSMVSGAWAPGWEDGTSRVVTGADEKRDRRKRLIGLGNSLVPQIPELIGRAILAAEAAT